MKIFLKIIFISASIYFFSWILVWKFGINTLSIQSEDTLPAMFLPITIIKEHTLYLDTYYQMLLHKYPHPDDKKFEKGLVPFYLKKITGMRLVIDSYGDSHYKEYYHYASAFPIITGILAIPIYIIPLALNFSINFENLTIMSHLAAAFIVACSGGFFYLLLKKHFIQDSKLCVILTCIYLFGTINYALLSQALWQHGTLELFLILGLLFLYQSFSTLLTSKRAFFYTFFSSVMFGFAVLSRPTALLFIPFLFPIVLRNLYHFKSTKSSYFKYLGMYALGFFIPILFFFWYNNTFYLSIQNQGYANQIFNYWLSPFPISFFGVWISPSKGILVYSPVFLFSLVGGYISAKKLVVAKFTQPHSHFDFVVFGVIILVHTLIISKWKHWYGGWSFGYRMSSDVVPFFVLLLVPYIEYTQKARKLFYILAILSVCIQIYGIIFFDGIWHSAYDKGFTNTGWLWSIRDSELVFNVRRVLVKLNLLDKACPQC